MADVIVVSGLMGSGKTTLAKNLSRLLNWSYLPENLNAKAYLEDLFKDQSRWAFETQISFLIDKGLQLINKLEQKENVVLDRSLSEDIFVFAEYFYRKKSIDERGFHTYREIASYFLQKIPLPKITIYCKCSIGVVKERIINRSRVVDARYPSNHIEDIGVLYDYWLKRKDVGQIFEVDSERHDFRNVDVVQVIASEIEYWLTLGAQRDLFATSEIASEREFLLRPVSPLQPEKLDTLAIGRNSKNKNIIFYPSIYIAAPFSALATTDKLNHEVDIFGDENPHGIIKLGSYRRMLSNLSRSLSSLGVKIVLPHRDINKWGKKLLTSKDVYELCTEHVVSCDLFVGILGESPGSHYEFGLALAAGKPCVIIHCDEIKSSYISLGVRKTSKVFVYKCKNISDISKILLQREVRSFMNRPGNRGG